MSGMMKRSSLKKRKIILDRLLSLAEERDMPQEAQKGHTTPEAKELLGVRSVFL